MRIYNGADPLGGRDGRTEGVEHLSRVGEIEERIDQQILALIDNQSRVAVTPAAVGLQPCVATVAKVMQSLGEFPTCHELLSSGRGYGSANFRSRISLPLNS